MLPALPTYAAAGDYALANGHFFTQSGDGVSTGYAVRDDSFAGGVPMHFWSEYQRLGGIAVLGYPISRVYRDDDGFYYQLFQRAMLQWRPEANAAVFANVLDKLSATGADPWLASQGVPSPVADDGSRGNFDAAVSTRLDWLTEPRIKAFYLATGSTDVRRAIDRYGLPTSYPVRSGPFVVQRFQRVAFQLWVDPVPGMPAPGSVVPVNAGDLFRQFGVAHGLGLADQRFQPESAGQDAPAAPIGGAAVDDALRPALDLLAANPDGAPLAATLRSPGVRLYFTDVPAIALFSPMTESIAVGSEYRASDPKAIAAVLAHEASHLSDYLSGVDIYSSGGCYKTEYTAFTTQARVWRDFYGPGGKAQPADRLDVELNRILSEVTTDPQGFAALLTATYKSECGG